MNFTVIDPAPRAVKMVYLETDEVRFLVGEISNDQSKGWKLHYSFGAGGLKPAAAEALKAFAAERIKLIQLTERLLA